MRFLTWLGIAIVYAVTKTIIEACGITLGAIPTFALLTILWIPADRLHDAWYIKKYKGKFPNDFIVDANKIIASYKIDFVKKKIFFGKVDGIEIFDSIKNKFSDLNTKKINKIMIHIVKSDLTPSTYILDLLENESLKLVRQGNAEEIMKRKGKTYTMSKIYEYVNDIRLENRELNPLQHKNKLANIEYICKEKLNETTLTKNK